MKYSKIFALFFIYFFAVENISAQKYFGSDSITPMMIDKPFSMNSEKHKSEIEQIILLQKNVEPKEIDLALNEKQLRPETVVQHINKSLTRKKFPNLYALLDRVGDTSREITDDFKDHFKITRPYLVDKNIQMFISPSKGYCYPSGHTTGSYIYGNVMSLLIPKKSQEFLDYANQISWHRVQVGMHYPQDLAGGKQLATLLIGGLTQNKEFQADFKKAQEELKKAGVIN
jgi:acid phosphatase (class A)